MMQHPGSRSCGAFGLQSPCKGTASSAAHHPALLYLVTSLPLATTPQHGLGELRQRQGSGGETGSEAGGCLQRVSESCTCGETRSGTLRWVGCGLRQVSLSVGQCTQHQSMAWTPVHRPRWTGLTHGVPGERFMSEVIARATVDPRSNTPQPPCMVHHTEWSSKP